MKATPLCIALLSVVEPSLTLSAARGWPRTGARRTHPRMAGFVTPRSELTPKPQTVTLTGCMDGVGVGLDVDNCVDMLTPGKPAAAVLQLGDKITEWNGVAMFDPATGERRLLKEVVTAAESHTLVIDTFHPLLRWTGRAAEWARIHVCECIYCYKKRKKQYE